MGLSVAMRKSDSSPTLYVRCSTVNEFHVPSSAVHRVLLRRSDRLGEVPTLCFVPGPAYAFVSRSQVEGNVSQRLVYTGLAQTKFAGLSPPSNVDTQAARCQMNVLRGRWADHSVTNGHATDGSDA